MKFFVRIRIKSVELGHRHDVIHQNLSSMGSTLNTAFHMSKCNRSSRKKTIIETHYGLVWMHLYCPQSICVGLNWFGN
jgi:hypothetical protein